MVEQGAQTPYADAAPALAHPDLRSSAQSIKYTLHHLAPGSYDLALDGVIVGGVVRETTAGGASTGWCAELLEDLPAATRPRPFDCVEHRFPTLEAATAWLGGAPVLEAFEGA